MKFLNSLDILGSGGTLLDVQGSQGQLFSVTDSLSGSIFAVSDISGVPIMDVNSSGLTTFDGNVNLPDNKKILLGTGNDLQIYHDGSDSYINDTGAGDLRIVASKTRIYDADLSHLQAQFTDGGSVDLYYSGNKKFETTSTGVAVTGSIDLLSNGGVLLNGGLALFPYLDDTYIRPYATSGDIKFQNYSGNILLTLSTAGPATFTGTVTAPTFLGDLNGTINTVTTAVTKANATNDTTVATTAFVQNLIGTIPAGLVFQGTWNAATNTPTLTSGSGTTGHFYIVSTSGSTNLDGVTDWVTGDWAVFIEQGGTDEWEKIDNSSVLDGAGTGQTVALWSGSGTSNTLTDAPITVSGNDSAFAGSITANTTSTPTALLGRDGTDGDVVQIYNGATGTTKVIALGASGNDGTVYSQYGDLLLQPSAGNVGIGTTSPGAKLQVKTATDQNIAFNLISGGALNGIQRISAYNDAITASVPLGISALELYFLSGASSTERMRIASDGNVGIGNTNPLAKLHAGGIVSDIGSLSLSQTGALISSVSAEQNSTRSNVLTLARDGISGVVYAGSATFDLSQWEVSTVEPRTQLTIGLAHTGVGSQSDIITLRSNGNVGIGTTAPAYKLTVESDTAYGGMLIEGNNAPGLSIRDHSSTSESKIYVQSTASSSGNLRISADNNNTATTPTIEFKVGGSEKMRILDNGNVGIGTAAPGAKLDVNGEIFASSNVQISATGAAGKYYIRRPSDGSASAFFGYNSNDNTDFGIYNGSGGGNVKFWSNNGVFQFNNVASSELMRITSGGNVGIGTTNPTIKFQAVQTTADWAGGFKNYAAGAFGLRVDLSGSSGVNAAFQVYTATGGGMLVKNNGNVGIGTTSPDYKLDVEGSANNADIGIRINNTFDDDLATSNPNAALFLGAASNNGYLRVHGAPANTAAKHQIDLGSTAGDSFLTFSPNGGERMRIDSAGNVLIGAAANVFSYGGPTLHVGGSRATLALKSTGSLSTFVMSSNNSVNTTDIHVNQNGTDGSLVFYQYSAGGTTMTLDGGGKLGIGVTAPQSKLQVDGGIQMADDTDAAAAAKVGTMRYRTGTEYVEVDGVDLADGWDFTSGWNAFGAGTSITNSTTFVSESGQGIYTGLGLTTTKTYKVVIAGTQPSGGYISIKAGTTGTSFGNISEQSFDKVLYATLTTVPGGTNSFYIRLADHAANTSIVITKLEIQEVTSEDASYADMCMQTGASAYEWVNIVRNTY